MSNNTPERGVSHLIAGNDHYIDGDLTLDFGTQIDPTHLQRIEDEGGWIPSVGVADKRTGEIKHRILPTIRFTLVDTYEERGAVWTKLTVTQLASGVQPIMPPLIGPIRVNLMNHTKAGWGGMKEQLDDAMTGVDWAEVLAHVKVTALTKIDEPIPRTNLAEAAADPRNARAPYLLKPYIASSGVSVFYGDGGTGKSVLAVAMAIEVASGYVLISDQRAFRVGPVIYADYEDEHDEHASRLAAMCRGNHIELGDLEIYHLALVGKVTTEIKRLRQAVIETNAALVILDSIGMGRGGDAMGPEDTIRMFRSLRSLGVPSLAIDHVTKESKWKKGSPDPFGSIYTRNSSRMAWHVEQRQARMGDPWEYLAFTHTKANHVRKQPPRYLKVKYVNAEVETEHGGEVEMIHSIEFEGTDVTGMPVDPSSKGGEDDKRITLLDEIMTALWTVDPDTMTAKELAEHLGRSQDTIRKTCHRGVEAGKLRQDTSGGFGLADEKPIPF